MDERDGYLKLVDCVVEIITVTVKEVAVTVILPENHLSQH